MIAVGHELVLGHDNDDDDHHHLDLIMFISYELTK